MNTEKITCKVCKTTFKTPTRYIKRGGGKYCSYNCSSIGRRISKLRKCLFCSKEFKVKPSRINDGRGKYCSNKCKYLAPERAKNVILRNKTRDYSRCKYTWPQVFKQGHVPWNKGFKNCFNAETINKLRKYRLTQKFMSSNTSIERKVKERLSDLGLEFESQYNLDDRFLIDIAIPKLKLAIECDGDYWHSLPTAITRDRIKDDYCLQNNWKLLRFTETQINSNLDKCVNIILNEIIGMGVIY